MGHFRVGAGGRPSQCLSRDLGFYLHSRLLPLLVSPSWPRSVKTAHSLCWTLAWLRCKCEVEPCTRDLGSGAVGGWVLFLFRNVHCLFQGDWLTADHLPVPGADSQPPLCLVEESVVGGGIAKSGITTASQEVTVYAFRIKNHIREIQPVTG